MLKNSQKAKYVVLKKYKHNVFCQQDVHLVHFLKMPLSLKMYEHGIFRDTTKRKLL